MRQLSNIPRSALGKSSVTEMLALAAQTAKNLAAPRVGVVAVALCLAGALSSSCLLFAGCSSGPTEEELREAAEKEAQRVLQEQIAEASNNPLAVPLVITEVCFVNTTTPLFNGAYPAWIEVHNTSKQEVNLADFRLGTAWETRTTFTISDFTLAADDYAIIFCDGIAASTALALPYTQDCGAHTTYVLPTTPTDAQDLWLTDADGNVLDYFDLATAVADEDFSACASCGRLKDAAGAEAETAYFAVSTPRGKNRVTADTFPLRITEATLTNSSLAAADGEYYDLVELTNVSSAAVRLSNYCLSDKYKKLAERVLPDIVLAAGESVVVYCDTDAAIEAGQSGCWVDEAGQLRAPFSLSAGDDEVWLAEVGDKNEAGAVCDHVDIPADVPVGGSYAVLGSSMELGSPARTQWVYSTTPLVNGLSDDTILRKKPVATSTDAVHETGEEEEAKDTQEAGETEESDGTQGLQEEQVVEAQINARVTPKVIALSESGVYDKVTSLTLDLFSLGTIYYTTDGSVPTTASAVYSASSPLVLTATTIVRTLCVEQGCLPSRVSTLSYFLNEDFSLPVLSIATDDADAFYDMTWWCVKNVEIAGSVALYENGEERFNAACGIGLKGWTSIYYDKQSFYVAFRGKYGDGDIDCDVFDSGVSKYSSLAVRAGQDYKYSFVRNEFLQNLVLQANSNLVTQHSKYCILYIDGDYRGIYCMKEDLNTAFYANYMGLEKAQADSQRAANAPWSFYEYVTRYGMLADMTVKENYEEFCRHVNIDSLIDYFIFEGYSANSDTLNNLRYFTSDADEGRWYYSFYDLDWSFNGMQYCFDNIYYGVGNGNKSVAQMFQNLGTSTEFRDALFTRLATLLKTTLSDENVLAEIEARRAEIAADLPRDFERWNLSYNHYVGCVTDLEEIIRDGYAAYCLEKVCAEFNVTDEERAKYFAGL